MATKSSTIQCGSCRVSYDGEDLGYTIDGVIATYTEETEERYVDSSDLPIDVVVTRRGFKVEATLAEYSLERLKNLLGGTSRYVTSEGGEHLVINGGLEGSKKNFAKTLQLIPLNVGVSHLITIYHAIPTVGIEWTYSKDSIRGTRVLFTAVHGESGFVSFGDQSLTFGGGE